MNERLAFYCNRDTAPGHLYTRVEPDPEGPTLLQVWCPTPLSDGLPAATAGDPAGLRAVLAAGGGLIAATGPGTAGTPGTRIQIETVPAPDYDPATEVLVLRPGLDPEWTAFDRGTLTLGPDRLGTAASVLVPATRADQTTLRGLLEHLRPLPDDYRSLVLNVLRRPGIEGALWQLERRLADFTAVGTLGRDRAVPGVATASDATKGTTTGAATGVWPWVLAGLLVIDLVAVLGAAWWLKGANGTTPAPVGTPLVWPGTPGPDRYWPDCGPPWFGQPPALQGAAAGGAATPKATQEHPAHTGDPHPR